MSRFLTNILPTIYSLLYNQFAWSYDLVASLVSAGHWSEWVQSAIPDLTGTKILELGFGPGHLQVALKKLEKTVIGLDASWVMARMAYRNLTNEGYISCCINGYAQYLPLPSQTFDHIVATFPSDYIFDPRVAYETQRVLKPNGSVIIILSAWPLPKTAHSVAGYSLLHHSIQPEYQIIEKLQNYSKAGFTISISRALLQHSVIIKVIAQKFR